MRLVRAVVLFAALATVSAPWGALAQQFQKAPAKAPPKDQMFSGVVTAIDEGSLTAVRAGSKESKNFAITSETKFDGPRPKVGQRVTVRYVVAPDGDRALVVVARDGVKK